MLNYISSINNDRSFAYKIRHPELKVEGLKSGILEINAVKIKIDSNDSLHQIAKKINSKSLETKVEAKIIKDEWGYRLQLQSKNKEINIVDYKGVLLTLYKNQLLGTKDSCLIQAVRTNSDKNSEDIILNYKYISVKHIINYPIISEANKFILSNIVESYFVEPSLPIELLEEENKQNKEQDLVIPVRSIEITISQPSHNKSSSIFAGSKSEPSLFFNSSLKRLHKITPTKGKQAAIQRFNEAINHVFKLDKSVRIKFGLMVEKDKIKFFPESDLYKEDKELTADKQITKKLYSIYNSLA